MPSEDKGSVLFPVYTGRELYRIILPVRINWAITLANNGTLMTAKQRHLRAAPLSALLPARAPRTASVLAAVPALSALEQGLHSYGGSCKGNSFPNLSVFKNSNIFPYHKRS